VSCAVIFVTPQTLDLFEEAEFGFRKAVEFGDHELDTCFGLIFFNS
jgi:hypothetical protein